MWTIEEARELISVLQTKVKEFEYHIVLGGSVLNNGKSDKDLDLFFLKLNGYGGKKSELYDFLHSWFKPLRSIRDSPDYQLDCMWHYRDMQMGKYNGKRVDLFIQ